MLGEKGPGSVDRDGGYEDIYVKTAKGWRIKSRTHVRSKEWSNPLLQSADRNKTKMKRSALLLGARCSSQPSHRPSAHSRSSSWIRRWMTSLRPMRSSKHWAIILV